MNEDKISFNIDPVLKAARQGYTINYKNKTLLSTVDPVSQAERIANGINRKDRTLYFCPSPLLGYGLSTLLSLASADSAVLCVETDEKLLSLSVSSIDRQILLHPRIAFTGINNAEQLCGLIREKWGPRAFRRVETLRFSGGWQLDSDNYNIMEELIRSSFAVDWGNAMTIAKLGRRFMYNVIRNICFLEQAQSIKELSFGAKPVLVLGAGPSLDFLLNDLQKAGVFNLHKKLHDKQERNFALVCVDTCLTLLKEREITPDLAIVLESQFWNLRDFNGSRNTGIPAAVDISAYPGTVQLLGGPVYMFCTPWTPLRFFDRFLSSGLMPPNLPPLGSVGLSAVEISRHLSSGLILTGGIDFSFTIDNIHARSSPAHLSKLLSQNRFTSPFNTEAVFFPGVFNTVSKTKKPVKSNPSMRTYRNLFEKEFSGSRIKDIEGSGLSLGLETLCIEEVIKILLEETNKNNSHNEQTQTIVNNKSNSYNSQLKTIDFIRQEKLILEELRTLLTGSASSKNNTESKITADDLLDKADYLWAHFPDCAGAEGKRPLSTDIGFLKRVRTEIDPFIKLWEMAERESIRLSKK